MFPREKTSKLQQNIPKAKSQCSGALSKNILIMYIRLKMSVLVIIRIPNQ